MTTGATRLCKKCAFVFPIEETICPSCGRDQSVRTTVAGKPGERATLDFPAVLRGPDKVGGEPGRGKEQRGGGCQEGKEGETTHENGAYQRIRVAP